MTSELRWRDGQDVPNLAFYGPMGAGKTTCSQYVQEKYNYRHLSFASELKHISIELWGMEEGMTRGKLQDLGLALRGIDEDVWVNCALQNMRNQNELEPDPVHWVSDDCRFPNEYWALKKREFIFIRVLAHEELRATRLLNIDKLDDPEQLHHPSEKGLIGMAAVQRGIEPDYTIGNEGTLDELYNQIEGALNDIEART